MNRTVGKCLTCNRLFQALDKNRGTIHIGGFIYPVELCDYHLERIEHAVKLAQEIANTQGKP